MLLCLTASRMTAAGGLTGRSEMTERNGTYGAARGMSYAAWTLAVLAALTCAGLLIWRHSQLAGQGGVDGIELTIQIFGADSWHTRGAVQAVANARMAATWATRTAIAAAVFAALALLAMIAAGVNAPKVDPAPGVDKATEQREKNLAAIRRIVK